MQGFTYENQGQNTYLVYQFDDRPIDTMALGMLTNNKIKGFAPAIYTEIDNQKFIKYNVSSHVTLSKLFMGDVRKIRLLKTFVNIVDAMQMLDAYMLDRRTIMLDRDYIYVDASTSDVSMICVPVVDEFDPVDEREFFKNIIFSVSFAANENGDYVARILAYLNSVELFQLQDFKKMLEGLMSEQPAVGMQNVQPAMGAPYMQNNPYQQTPAGAPAQPQMNMKPAVMQQPVPPVQPQNRPTDIGQEPAIQNVYVSSGASAKDIKLAKREEMLKQQEEERAREMARNPIAPENVDMGFAVPGMSTNQYASKPKAVSAAPAQKASKGKKNSGSSEDDISLFYLMQHYSKENKEKYKAAKERKKSGSTATEAPVAKKQASVIEKPKKPDINRKWFKKEKRKENREKLEDTMLIHPSSETAPEPVPRQIHPTVCLSDYREHPQGMLLYEGMENRSNIIIDKDCTRIGQGDEADAVIGKDTISHFHAVINRENQEFYLEDLNSTNGTFVNNEVLAYKQKKQLKSNDIIRFADVKYRFV